MTETRVAHQVMTVPNVVSVSRLVLLLPLSLYFLLHHDYVASLISLFFLGVSDGLDGFLARHLHQTSLLGKYLDVLADRISIFFIGLGVALADLVPWWIVLAVGAIDLTVAAVTWTLFHGPPPVPVSMAGKVRTALLLVGFPAFILAAALDNQTVREAAMVVTLIGLVFAVVAGAGYIVAMVRFKRP